MRTSEEIEKAYEEVSLRFTIELEKRNGKRASMLSAMIICLQWVKGEDEILDGVPNQLGQIMNGEI